MRNNAFSSLHTSSPGTGRARNDNGPGRWALLTHLKESNVKYGEGLPRHAVGDLAPQHGPTVVLHSPSAIRFTEAAIHARTTTQMRAYDVQWRPMVRPCAQATTPVLPRGIPPLPPTHTLPSHAYTHKHTATSSTYEYPPLRQKLKVSLTPERHRGTHKHAMQTTDETEVQ